MRCVIWKNSLLRKGFNSAYDFIKHVIDKTRDTRLNDGWTSILFRWIYDEEHFFQLDYGQYLPNVAEAVLKEDNSISFQRQLFNSLTLREKQIFQLLANGLTQDAICGVLNIKLATLKCHQTIFIRKWISRIKPVFYYGVISSILQSIIRTSVFLSILNPRVDVFIGK